MRFCSLFKQHTSAIFCTDTSCNVMLLYFTPHCPQVRYHCKDDLSTWVTLSQTIIAHYERVAPGSQKGTNDSIKQVQLSHKSSTNQCCFLAKVVQGWNRTGKGDQSDFFFFFIFFLNFWRIWYQQDRSYFFSLSMANFTAGKCFVWKISKKTYLAMEL